MHDFHFPHINLLTLSSIQRQAYILNVHVRCTTSETFYSVKISVARATKLRRLIVGIAGLLQCTHLLAFAPNSLYTVRILNTAVVFSSKSRSGYVLNPDLLSEVDFCRLCGFIFTDKWKKKNKVSLRKCLKVVGVKVLEGDKRAVCDTSRYRVEKSWKGGMSI